MELVRASAPTMSPTKDRRATAAAAPAAAKPHLQKPVAAVVAPVAADGPSSASTASSARQRVQHRRSEESGDGGDGHKQNHQQHRVGIHTSTVLANRRKERAEAGLLGSGLGVWGVGLRA